MNQDWTNVGNETRPRYHQYRVERNGACHPLVWDFLQESLGDVFDEINFKETENDCQWIFKEKSLKFKEPDPRNIFLLTRKFKDIPFFLSE